MPAPLIRQVLHLSLACAVWLAVPRDPQHRFRSDNSVPFRWDSSVASRRKSVPTALLLGHWTNGSMEYHCDSAGQGKWQFRGASVHEGGSYFMVTQIGDSIFEIGNRLQDPQGDALSNQPDFGKHGDRLVLRRIKGRRVLLAMSPSGAFHDFLFEVPKSFDLALFIRANRTRYQLSGNYVDSASHRAVDFSADRPVVTGLPGGSRYQFAAPYDYPDNVLIFSKKKAYCYIRTDEGIELLEAIDHGDEEYTAGRRLMSLRQIGWPNLSGDSSLMGRFSYASAFILTYDIAGDLTPGQRRICRNEIYARHGYIFRTSDMKAYFLAQPWYRPRYESVGDLLTDLERLNLQILQSTPN